MGRGLTRGREHTVFPFGEHARIGMNICYEDVFPEISRAAVLRGANVLMTITNDAWYWETAGSRQHTINAVFRAVETMRPFFRSGNNSDTCLVMPDGTIRDRVVDPATGNPFVRRAAVIEVPVYADPPITFYTRYGNLFAILCFLGMLGIASWCGYRSLHRRQRLRQLVDSTRT